MLPARLALTSILLLLALLLNFNCDLNGDYGIHQKSNVFKLMSLKVSNIKRSKSRVLYYSNSTASFQLVLSGDIELNPGPGLRAPKCDSCNKTVKSNQKRLVCEQCFNVTHAKCVNMKHHIANSKVPCNWICNNCTHRVLPFFNLKEIHPNESLVEEVYNDLPDTDIHLQKLQANRNHTSIAHLNTQCITSKFDEFNVMINRYEFDIITLTETWLKDNIFMLDYVKNMPGYQFEYRNRSESKILNEKGEEKKGGGLACYIKNGINYKIRTDIEKIDPSIEHQWLEISGKNRNSSYLLGTFYQPSSVESEKQAWLDKFDTILSKVFLKWEGIVILTGDFNIDLLNSDTPTARKYLDILQSFELSQHISRATRKDKTLIDHIMSTIPEKIVYENIVPCDTIISDHDAPYTIINIRKQKFENRYKVIRDEKSFNLLNYKEDFSQIPLSILYALDDPEEQISVLNDLITECLNKHAPLKRVKFTRPPAPWMKAPAITRLQNELSTSRELARTSGKSYY